METKEEQYLKVLEKSKIYEISRNVPVNKELQLIENVVQTTGLFTDILEQYNSWLTTRLPEDIKGNPIVLGIKGQTDPKNFRKITFIIKSYTQPMYSDKLLYPMMARDKKINYFSNVYADIYMQMPKIDINGSVVIENNEVIYNDIDFENTTNVIKDKLIFSLPVLVRSFICNSNSKTSNERMLTGMSPEDPGCYFIVSGNTYVVIGQQVLDTNKPIIREDSDNKGEYVLRYTSKIYGYKNSQLLMLKKLKDESISLILSINYDIVSSKTERKNQEGFNIFTIYKLFYENDSVDDIINFILKFVNKKYRTKVKILLNATKLNYINNKLTLTEVYKNIMKSTLSEDDERNVTYDNLDDNFIKNDILNKLFPENKDINYKLTLLSNLVIRYCEFILGYRGIDNLDSWINSKVLSSTGNLEKIVSRSWLNAVNMSVKKFMDKNTAYFDKSLESILNEINFETLSIKLGVHFTKTIFAAKKWGPFRGRTAENVAEMLNEENPLARISHIGKVVAPVSDQSQNVEARLVESTQILLFDPSDTPESKKTGIIKNRTILCRYSNFINPYDILELISTYLANDVSDDFPDMVIVGGLLVGFANGLILGEYIRNNIKTLYNTKYIGVVYEQNERTLYVLTDMGYPVVPLFVVNKETGNLIIDEKNMWNAPYNDLVSERCIEYLNAYEISKTKIAQSDKDMELRKDMRNSIIKDLEVEGALINNKKYVEALNKFPFYSYKIIHGITVNSMVSTLIPFLNFNQAVRVMYAIKHLTQAIGLHTGTVIEPLTSVKQSQSSQKPIVRTSTYKLTGIDKLPGGENIIIAIITWNGLNMEDGIILNKRYLDLGGFMYTIYRTIVIETENSVSNGQSVKEEFYKPVIPPEKDNLDDFGIIKLNSKVEPGTIIVGKRRVIDGNESKAKDASYKAGGDDKGYVDEITRDINPNTKTGKIIIRLRYMTSAKVGDKFADRHAQKTTGTKIVNPEDMPTFMNGSTPAAVFSPWAIPSRMTMGKLWEMIFSLYGILIGENIDATAFEKYDVDKMMKGLEFYGFNPMGKRKMIDGMTGREFESMVFAGPNYQQLLKHLIDYKQTNTETGNVLINAFTRQPIGGRSGGIGLRLGEMEGAAMEGHSAIELINSLFNKQQDAVSFVYCKNCSQELIPDLEHKYVCKKCKMETAVKFDVSASVDIFRKLEASAGILMKYNMSKK